MTLWDRRPVLAAVVAVVVGLPAGALAADGAPQAPQTTWQLRAQVRPGSGAGLSDPRTLPAAISLVRQAACRRAGDLLGDGDPKRTRVQLTLWRQPGPTDQAHARIPHMRCHVGLARTSAFALRTSVAGRTGWLSPAKGVRRMAEVANSLAPQIMATGEQVWVTLELDTREKPVRPMIRALAGRHGVDLGTALSVAACESHFNAQAYDYPYAGVYQQDVRFWPRRARHFGHPGASPFDAYANVDVSLKMARAMGWGHWGCA